MNDPTLGRSVDRRNRRANLIGGALWRTAVVAVAYGLVLVATMAAIVLPAVLRHR